MGGKELRVEKRKWKRSSAKLGDRREEIKEGEAARSWVMEGNRRLAEVIRGWGSIDRGLERNFLD